MFANAIRLALREITRNALRSFLTMLGIVIGVMAVIVMVTLGGGATEMVRGQIAALGSNLLMITPGSRMGPGQISGAGPFSIADTEAIRTEIPGVRAAASTANGVVVAIYGNANWSTTVTGSTNDYFDVGNWSLADGRIFTDSEIRAGSAACVIGETVRRELFGAEHPVGARIRLNKISCEVVGLLESKGQSGMGMDQDDVVVMPLRAFHRRIAGNQDVRRILVSVDWGYSTEAVQAEVAALLRERRRIAPGQNDDFGIMDTRQIAQTVTGTTQVLTMLLGAVAGVSLLVGGIGIMNIMLVSVTERTREIGTRLAIGALERDVLSQFLIEAITLASIGGVIGIVLALATAAALAQAISVPFAPQMGVIALAFFFSAAVGVVFGYFPARRAALLNPIDALRHE
jgi:putative ABC transport system permease protein